MDGCMYQPYLFMFRMNDLKPEMKIQKYYRTTDWVLGGLKTQRELIWTQYKPNWSVRILNTEWTVSNLRTQHSYVIFNSVYLLPSV